MRSLSGTITSQNELAPLENNAKSCAKRSLKSHSVYGDTRKLSMPSSRNHDLG